MGEYNILIAGGSGNIGRFLVSHLRQKDRITIIGNSFKISRKNFYNIDLTNFDEINNFIINNKKFDILIFLVGLAHKKGTKNDYDEFYNINYITLKNIYKIFEKENKIPNKIIFTSTISIYGERMDLRNYTEDTIPNPKSPYAKTKLEAENYLINHSRAKNWILRLAPVYSDLFTLNIDRRTKIMGKNYVIGDGSAKFSLCNIKNISFTIDNIINENLKPGVYNVSDNKNYSYSDLLMNRNSNYIIKIPKFFVHFSYYLGKSLNNNFLIENSLKLINDNIYPSKKISKQINLPHIL